MENVFELASRNKFRFASSKGTLTVEDLWSVPLTVLDDAYKNLSRFIRESDDDSLLSTKTSEIDEATTKRDLVKYILKTRQKEAENVRLKAENRLQAEKIKERLAQRRDKALDEKSDEELLALLETLK